MVRVRRRATQRTAPDPAYRRAVLSDGEGLEPGSRAAYWVLGMDPHRHPRGPAAAEQWRVQGAEILSEWISARPGTRPAAWWLNEGGRDRPYPSGIETERPILERVGALTAGEREALDRG